MTTAAHPHPRTDFDSFRVDPDAFDDWFALRADTIENELPTPATRGPAAALGSLVEEAIVFGPIVGDDRVELDLITADDPPGPGYVLIVRPRGQQTSPGVTYGWTNLTYPPLGDDPRAIAWTFLTTICEQANELLTDTRKVLPRVSTARTPSSWPANCSPHNLPTTSPATTPTQKPRAPTAPPSTGRRTPCSGWHLPTSTSGSDRNTSSMGGCTDTCP